MMRKVIPKEGLVTYYHVYSKKATASAGVVFKVQGSNLECMTKGMGKEKMIESCGLYIEDGILKSNEDYITTEISLNRAIKKIEASKYNNFSMHNWNE